MNNFGEFLIGLGVMGCIFFFFKYDTTVSVPSNPVFSGRVVNLHKSQTQTMGIAISVGAAIVGAILVASAKPEDNDDRPRVRLPKENRCRRLQSSNPMHRDPRKQVPRR